MHTGAVTVVDEKVKKHVAVGAMRGDAVATSSFDGRYFVSQKANRIEGAFPFPESSSNFTAVGYAVSRDRPPPLHQVHPSKFWFGGNQICAGEFPQTLVSPRGRFIIPDQRRHVVYQFDESAVSCLALNDELTDLGSQHVSLPAAMLKRQTFHNQLNSATYTQNIAVTLGDTTYFALFNGPLRTAYLAATSPFEMPTVIQATAATTCGVGKGLPLAIPVNKEQKFFLLGKSAAGEYEVTSGPANLKVSDEGLTSWSPTDKEIGFHRIKITAKVDGHATTLRLDTRVVLPEHLERALANPTTIENAGRHYLTSGTHSLSYGQLGDSILLLQQNIIQVLDPTGTDVIVAKPNEKAYRAIEARKDYYVALGTTFVDLLDKKTFEPISTIDLALPNTGSLSLHPAKQLCYVCVAKPEHKDDPVRGTEIVEINELAGSWRELSRVYGSSVKIDPRGRFLYTRLHSGGRKSVRIRRRPPAINSQQPVVPKTYSKLLCYQLQDGGDAIRFVRASDAVGNGFLSFDVSPDGDHVTCLCRNTQGDSGQKNLLVFRAGVDGDPASLPLDRYPTSVSFHPVLPLAAATNGERLVFYNSQSGEVREDMLHLLEGESLQSAGRVFFAPSGMPR